MVDHKVIGIVAALASAASWAAGAVILKKLGDDLSSLAMTLVKGLVSIVLLAVPLAFIGFERVGLQPLLLLAASGVLGIAVSDSCFFEALKGLGPLPLVLLMTVGQVFTVIFAVLFLGEQPTLVRWLAILLILVGIGIVVSASIRGEKAVLGFRGLAFGLASVISMAVSTIVAKKALDAVSGTVQATFIRMVAGTLGMLLLGLVSGRLRSWMNPFRDVRVIGPFSLAVIIVTFGGFWLSLVAFKYTEVYIANPLISTEPLFVLPLAAVFLKEKITAQAVVGTLVTLAGAVALCFS